MKKHIIWILLILLVSLPNAVLAVALLGAKRPIAELFIAALKGAHAILGTNDPLQRAVLWIPLLLSVFGIVVMIRRGNVIGSYVVAFISSAIVTTILFFGLFAMIGP